MRRWLFVSVLVLVVAGFTFASSFFALDYFYGTGTLVTNTENIIIENSGAVAIYENAAYLIENITDSSASYRLKIEEYVAENTSGFGVPGDYSQSAPPSVSYLAGSISVPKSAYDQAQQTNQPVVVSSTTVTEVKPIDVKPIAASISIAAGVVAVAIWVGYRRNWGDATSTLLEQGLHDMTVRDVEILGYIMNKGEFTIPEIMKLTKASKLTVWRTVQKLEEQEIVRRAQKTNPAASGLGGRGKPSNVYKYIGIKKEEKIAKEEKGAKSEKNVTTALPEVRTETETYSDQLAPSQP